MNKKIYPCVWFDNNASEAADFYCQVFRDAEITSNNALVSTMKIKGEKLMLLNGGPVFVKNPSISLTELHLRFPNDSVLQCLQPEVQNSQKFHPT